MAAATKFVPAPNAVQVVERVAAPALGTAADAIAAAIPEQVPVQSGAAKASYRTTVVGPVEYAGTVRAQVWIGSPFWHFLEYGTRFNAPYRPIERGVAAVGLEFAAK